MVLSLNEKDSVRIPIAPPRYRIDALCGQGGVGSVFRAWDQELGRTVALKFLRDDRPEHRARMLREARAQARIDHPNVCRIFDVAEEGDRLFIAMQWIDGEQLGVVSPLLSLEQKIGLMREVADGIHAGHAEGVIHRDLKPANILVERREDGTLRPWVVDFGLARAIDDAGTTATGEIIGTPQYLSPEQAWGLPVDRRSDVYSLGATLYELLAGRPPFRGDTATEVVMQVIARPATPLHRIVKSIPRDISVIVGACLEKEPERRYDSARALRDDLARWLAGEPIAARSPGLLYRVYSQLRRHRALATAIVIASLITGGIGGYRIVQLQKQRAQREVTARLEDRVRYIERLLDHDRALPLHDTRPAIARASREIASLSRGLEEEAERFPSSLAYAEGRAWLAAGELDLARKSLERAWNAGLRAPASAYHYAVALTGEYARELSAIERIEDPRLRRKRVAELQRTYGSTTLPLLRAARGSVEQSSEFVEARIAFIEADQARAIAATNRVIARFPWNNEARLLQAEAYVRAARSKRLAGDAGAASESFEKASRVYEEAAVIAPSDTRIHDGLCQIAVDRMQIAGPFSTQIPGDVEARFAQARSSCDRALIADPELVSAWVALSAAWSLRSFSMERIEGESNALRAAGKALEIAPNDPDALVQAGLTHWRMGYGHGERAEQFLRRAVQADPRSLEARHSLGRALLLRHEELTIQGKDPRGTLHEAVKQYREIARMAPDYIGASSNLAIALYHLGTHTALLGGDPQRYHREAIAILDPVIARGPDLAEPRAVWAWNWFEIAKSRASTELDASSELAQALLHIDEAIRLNPGSTTYYQWRAKVRLLKARVSRDAITRTRELTFADEDLRAAETVARGLSSTSLIRAEWSMFMAASEPNNIRAIRYLDGAEGEIERFVARLPYPFGDAWAMRGRLQRMRWRRSLDPRDLARSEASFRRALELTPALRREIERERVE